MTNMPLNASTLPASSLPTRRDEAWKWTDVRAAAAEQGGLSDEGLPKFTLPDGVSIMMASSDISPNSTPMTRLTSYYGGPVWTVNVPDGFSSDTPLVIEGLGRGHIRMQIDLGKNAKLSVIEHHAGDANSFVNLDTLIQLSEGAVLDRVIVQADPETHVRIATTHVTAWANAEFIQHTLAFGGKLARLETRFAGMGKAVKATMNGAYLIYGKRHCDMTSYVDLVCPNGFIRQSVKGVTADKARGVFQGKFHVRRPAQHTDAEMRHDAIMLSDTSEIRSKPELEIYADDVECAHGNTIGALDESALFYMRQRGIPLAEAKALLTEAFLASVFDTLEDEVMRESLLDKLRGWLVNG